MTEITAPVASKQSVLIVEDETIIGWDIALQLRELGFEPLGPVVTGEEAIEWAGRLKPQLVLMDIHLGSDMDGITAAQAIRTQYDIPSIFLSAFTTSVNKERAAFAQPLGYVAKPFSEVELHDVVVSALKK